MSGLIRGLLGTQVGGVESWRICVLLATADGSGEYEGSKVGHTITTVSLLSGHIGTV